MGLLPRAPRRESLEHGRRCLPRGSAARRAVSRRVVSSRSHGGARLRLLGVDNNLTALIDGFTPAQYTLAKGLAAGTVNLSLGLALKPVGYDWRLVLAAVALGAFSYGLSLVLYVGGAQQIGEARSPVLFAAAPFVGAVLSWVMLGEPVQPLQLVSALVMLAGIGLLLSS